MTLGSSQQAESEEHGAGSPPLLGPLAGTVPLAEGRVP